MLSLAGLTVGEVASLIGGGISLLHIVVPMVWTFILVAIIQGHRFDAVTWSSISHLLQGSSWPLILRSDGAVGNLFGKAVRWRVFFLSQCITFASVCLFVAHFLTPIPLVEVVRPADSFSDAEFAYAPDLSYYGQAMLESQDIYRRCGWNLYTDCPNSIYEDATIRNQYVNATVVNSTIPQITQDKFTSGTKNGTVAGPTDIKYRSYIMNQQAKVDNNASRPLGRLENLPMLILQESYHVVEGLIVDTFRGGVGIRNHTVPVGLEFGATWTEDLLWIRPDTRCTNTNLSLHFTVTNNASISYGGDLGYLRDDGGFYNIPASPPSPRWDTDEIQWRNVGSTPELKRSADILAWWNNQFTAWTMNLTSSESGNMYRGQLDNYAHSAATGAIKIGPVDGMFLDDLVYNRRADLKDDFHRYGFKCTGYWDDDQNLDGKPFVRCGYLFDVPTPEALLSGQTWRVDPGSGWKQNLYTCASAVTASVEQVTFSINGTSSLNDLEVLKVEPQNYSSDNIPLWGIEKVNSTKYQVWDLYKFWGLIDQSHANAPDVDVHRAPLIYLPSAVRGTLPTNMYDNFAAGGLFTSVWQSIYENAAAFDSISTVGIPNYSGKLDYGLTLKWRQLSQQGTAGAESILNLIWTDIVAFAVAGTKTGFEEGNAFSSVPYKNASALGVRKVRHYVRRVEYQDIRYAIPAFISGALFIIPLCICMVLLCFQHRSWRALNHYMNQTNMGRVSTQLMQKHKPGRISVHARTSEWSLSARKIVLDVPGVEENTAYSDTHENNIPLNLLHRRSSSRIDESEWESQESLVPHPARRGFIRNRSQYAPVRSSL